MTSAGVVCLWLVLAPPTQSSGGQPPENPTAPQVVPALDVGDITSLVCARLTLNLIGEMAHTGQIGRVA